MLATTPTSASGQYTVFLNKRPDHCDFILHNSTGQGILPSSSSRKIAGGIELALKVKRDEIMELKAISVARLLLAASFLFFSVTVQATPKAAEHEDAPVSMGADAVRPKISAKPAKQQVAGKARPTPKGKPVHAAKPPKTTRANQVRK